MRITDSPVERKEDDEGLPLWSPVYKVQSLAVSKQHIT